MTVQEAVGAANVTTAIRLDRGHGTLWGAASDYGDDYGIA
jgi:hypothetical protein